MSLQINKKEKEQQSTSKGMWKKEIIKVEGQVSDTETGGSQKMEDEQK